jgi:hypothetical protein
MNGIGSVARMTHPTWKDSIVLSEEGIFHRFNTKCAGRWEFTEDGLLRLSWFDWPIEIFSPLNECKPPKFLGDFCGEYQLAAES